MREIDRSKNPIEMEFIAGDIRSFASSGGRHGATGMVIVVDVASLPHPVGIMVESRDDLDELVRCMQKAREHIWPEN
jgi:hypothetical protein